MSEGGTLATILSSQENMFVLQVLLQANLFKGNGVSLGATDGKSSSDKSGAWTVRLGHGRAMGLHQLALGPARRVVHLPGHQQTCTCDHWLAMFNDGTWYDVARARRVPTSAKPSRAEQPRAPPGGARPGARRRARRGGGGCAKPIAFDPAAIAAHQMLAGAPPGFLLGAATSAYQIEGGNQNDWTAWEKGRYPDGTPHVADGTNASARRRLVESLALRSGGAAAARRQRLPDGDRVEPPRAGGGGVGRGRRRALPGDVRGAARGPHRADGHALSLHAADLGRGARRLGVGGRAGGAGGVRRPRGRGVRRSGRLVVHDQRAERAGGQELPGGAVAARRARSAARGAGAGGAHARARSHGGRAARRATGSTPTATGTRPGSGSPRTCASSTRIRPTRSTRSSPGPPTASTTSRSSTPSRSAACAWCCRA